MSLLERVRKALAPDYAVERELGTGGMGIVYEALDTRLRRKVAVKVLRPELATALAARRFLDEGRHLARVKHPNVVPVHDTGETDGLSWLVMDLVRGETLASRLGRGPLSEKETIALARDLLSALAAIGEQNIVHRDIKPANIFLEKGRGYIADFGISRTITQSDPDGNITAIGTVVGTPLYMSPEHRSGEEVGPASDQYSLALVLYECVTGRHGPSLYSNEATDWRAVPSSLAPAIKRALAAHPSERWPDAQAFASAIEPVRSFPRWPAGVVGLAIAGLIVWIIWPPPPRPACKAEAADPNAPGVEVTTPCARYESWVRAEALYQRGDWEAADTAYRGVLSVDSTCLACEFRLLEVDRWLERKPDSARIDRLRVGIPKFSERWRPLVGAFLAPAGRRIELLENLKNDYLEWPLPWYYLGSELFNRGSLFGRSRDDANDALNQQEALAPDFVPAWTDRTLARIAAGDSIGADSSLRLLRSLPRAQGLAQAQRLLAELAFAFRFTPNGLELWKGVSHDSALLAGLPQLPAGPRVLPGVGTPLGGVELGRAFERTDQRPLIRSGLIAEILGNVSLGRIDSARRAGRRLNAAFPSQQLVAFTTMLDAAVVLFDEESTASDAARVEATLIPLTSTVMPPAVRRDAAWLVALAAIRRRDPAAARTTLAMVADDPAPGYRRQFIAAALLGAGGQPDSALSMTNPMVTDLEAWDRSERSPFLRAAIRLWRAHWFEAMQASESARTEYRWHQHFHLPDYPVDPPLPADGDWAFSTLASWRQARLLDKAKGTDPGDSEVCASYRLVVERWSKGDARYRARADTARARVALLNCGRPA